MYTYELSYITCNSITQIKILDNKLVDGKSLTDEGGRFSRSHVPQNGSAILKWV